MHLCYHCGLLNLLKVCPSVYRLFELCGREDNLKLVCKELVPLQDVGPQKCLGFSVDGSRFASGGAVSTLVITKRVLNDEFSCLYAFSRLMLPTLYLKDGHFRLFEWPNMRSIVDEPRAHKSFQDMDFR